MSHGVPHIGYTYLNLLDSPELLLNLSNFHCRKKSLIAKLLRQGYRCFKLRKAFSKFYRRHSALLEKYSDSLKTLLQQGISEPEFYGDLVYRFRKIVGKKGKRKVQGMPQLQTAALSSPKRKRKPTNINKHKPNKRTKSTKISSLFPK